ncbi:MAG: 1-deoxy-D-xylulose-5-phosphate synthase [Bacteroidetes bacterium HGW-Bacteroidetes-9]|jgi:1-deoxy-D-xylulose-5-phosphate synthase|nr:MAG: 1-deoxy-D-xylulose-5-phosphate synthase [Bacteroidetes bacterium HGW-Bacteroidetes-9]
MSPGPGKLLTTINSPADLRKLSEEELPLLCAEIRQFIIDVISANPGHLGASLGAVELAVAIHYAYNTPADKLIWDVGHQAYAHKIITGRRDVFLTNRSYHGISGFPKMGESEYDAFGVGHSSTSISAALGMSIAAKLQQNTTEKHIAVIGDGSMTGGMAMEALNNAGVSKTNLLVVLNDNGIAIDKNVGAMREYLLDIVTSRAYNKLKDKVWKLMGGNTQYGKNSRAVVKQIGNALKSTILNKSNLFEAFNFRYFGPVDGHDVVRLAKLMQDIQKIPGPKLLHVVTVKGKGFEKAEQDQILYHSPGMFDKTTGEIIEKPCKSLPPKYQHVFGKTIIELAEKNDRIVGVTPAMPSGCSLNMMMSVMPDRAFDVGIAEQHAVTFSAGMAARGMVPFCNIYSSFMQRAYDQVIHDVAIQGLQVVFCLDRGGLVGEDGPTHHGAYDLAYFRAIPGLTITAPMNEVELRNLMFTAQLEGKGPFVIRYPRGRGMSTDWKKPFEEIETGKGRKLRDGDKVAILSIGHPGNFAVEAFEILEKEGIQTGHYDMRFLKPMDETILHEVFGRYKNIITIEDGTINGGLGSAVLEFMADHGYQASVKRLGIPDRFLTHGKPEELYAECGFDVSGIMEAVREILKSGK